MARSGLHPRVQWMGRHGVLAAPPVRGLTRVQHRSHIQLPYSPGPPSSRPHHAQIRHVSQRVPASLPSSAGPPQSRVAWPALFTGHPQDTQDTRRHQCAVAPCGHVWLSGDESAAVPASALRAGITTFVCVPSRVRAGPRQPLHSRAPCKVRQLLRLLACCCVGKMRVGRAAARTQVTRPIGCVCLCVCCAGVEMSLLTRPATNADGSA